MRILLVNFQMDMNSTALAWQHSVACKLAEACKKIVVLTEKLVPFDQPANMEIYQIPHFLFWPPFRWLGSKWLLNIPVYYLCKRNQFDACFIHMSMEWTYRLFPCFWRFNLPVLLWYAHGTVTRRLYLAHRCANRVITSTREGFRIPSTKLKVIGQGIDTSIFEIQQVIEPQTDIISVGRISRRKRVHLMLQVIDSLVKMNPTININLRLIGTTLTKDDVAYEQELKSFIVKRGLHNYIEFVGHVPITSIPKFYRSAFLHLNVSQTGSMDKAVLEALSCGCPVLTSNEAFIEVLGGSYPEFMVKDERPEAIAKQALLFYESRRQVDRNALRVVVLGQHDLQTYVHKIFENLQEIVKDRSEAKKVS